MALRNFRETTEERGIRWPKTLAGKDQSRQWEKLPKNTPVKWPIYRMVGNILARAKKIGCYCSDNSIRNYDSSYQSKPI